MGRLAALIGLAVLGFSIYNWWQIRGMKRELEAKRAVVRVSEHSTGLMTKMQRAAQRAKQARKLLKRGRYQGAATEIDGAIAEFSDAARRPDPAATKRLHRVGATFARFRGQTQEALRRVTPGGEKRAHGG
jgi:hypothetical protein